MNDKKDNSGLLSMCRKAGKLKIGMDMMKSSCDSGEAKAVFTASDLSDKSLKEVRFYCSKNTVRLYGLDMTMDALGSAIGKKTGIISVTDAGFAKALAKKSHELPVDNDFEMT